MGPTRSLVHKIVAASAALTAATLLLHLAARTDGGAGCCDVFLSEFAAPFSNSTDLDAVFRELIARNWLSPSGRALCVGPGSGAVSAAARRLGFRTVAVAAPAAACCGLPFAEASFDFAFSAALDRARVPALVVLEMERVLRPGRVGAVLWFLSRPVGPDGLMKAAAPVASWLRFSEVVGARAVNGSAMVVFRKRGFPGSAVARVGGGTPEAAVTRLPLSVHAMIELLRVCLLVRGGSLGKLV